MSLGHQDVLYPPCQPIAEGGADVHELDPAPPETLVAGTRVAAGVGGGLEVSYWVSEDGGQFPLDIWNPARGEVCIAGTDDYSGRCAPAGRGRATGFFADASCTQPEWE